MLEKIKFFFPEIIIFLFAAVTRFFNLGYPKGHIFDEVYHAFTAQELIKGNPAAWEWWNTPPPGFAYEWTHPPLAKEFMAFAILLLGDSSFSWRFFSAVFGVGIIILIYFIVLELFKNRKVALLSAFVASLDGLLLVMSRIAMNDIYFVFFSLLALLFFLKKRTLFMGISLGLALSSKWTGVFTIAIILIFYIIQNFKDKINPRKLFRFSLQIFIIPILIYLMSYIPFFLQRHIQTGFHSNYNNLQTFIELQQQMWWYHTNLKATHPFQSTPSDWIFNLRPVWLFVNQQGEKTANIYTLENPLIAWGGLLSIIFVTVELIKKFSFSKFFIVLGYLGFFILWIKSPRIMFNYHYLASTVFLTIALGFVLSKLLNFKHGKLPLFIICSLLFATFVYFYPLWTGIHLDRTFADQHFWIKSWR